MARHLPRWFWTEPELAFEREGRQQSWQGDVLGGVGDVEQAVTRHMARYPKAKCELPAFDSTGLAQLREGRDLIGGRVRKSLEDKAGPFGHLLKQIGPVFEVSVIFPEDMGVEVSGLPSDLYDPGIADMLQRAYERVSTGGYVLKVEKGETFNRRLHVMVAHAVGACPGVGHKTLNGPETVLQCAAYFTKRPWHNRENLVGYAQTVREYGHVSKRLRTGRLGSRDATLGDVLAILPGLDLIKRETAGYVGIRLRTRATAEPKGWTITVRLGKGKAFQVQDRGLEDLIAKVATFEAAADPVFHEIARSIRLHIYSRRQAQARAALEIAEFGKDKPRPYLNSPTVEGQTWARRPTELYPRQIGPPQFRHATVAPPVFA